jgi:hypothetical protein
VTVDVDDLASEISAGIYGDDRMSVATLNAAVAALSALVAEVERLRAEADEMRRWAEEAAHAENLNAQDARRVKEQIVAWLREPGEYVDPACARLADAIERGAYCREEKP